MDRQPAHSNTQKDGVAHDRVTELLAEAADERLARQAGSGVRTAPRAFRVRLGHALVAVGAAVAGEPRLRRPSH
ncbi:MAG: hypothetical protein ACLQBX_03660 [Candidatus Limnocylindrales bacterium]